MLSNAAQRQTEQLAHDRKQLQASCRAEALREATEKERLLDEKEHAIQTTWNALSMELLKDLMANKAELHQEIGRLDETLKTLLDSKNHFQFKMKSVVLTDGEKFVLDLGGEVDSEYAAANFSIWPVSDKDGMLQVDIEKFVDAAFKRFKEVLKQTSEENEQEIQRAVKESEAQRLEELRAWIRVKALRVKLRHWTHVGQLIFRNEMGDIGMGVYREGSHIGQQVLNATARGVQQHARGAVKRSATAGSAAETRSQQFDPAIANAVFNPRKRNPRRRGRR